MNDKEKPHLLYELSMQERAKADERARDEYERRQRKAARQLGGKTADAKPKEQDIQSAISKALEAAGYMVIRVNSSTSVTAHGTRLSAYRVVNINATSGHADLAVYKRGRVWMLEVKRPGGKPSETQVRFAECCYRYGVPYHVVTSPEEALDVLRLP